MPGYGDYKKLYFEEFKTMKWEGYDVIKEAQEALKQFVIY